MMKELQDARHELREELHRFTDEGLEALEADLYAGRCARGAWDGCPLSYRLGKRSSVKRDRHGYARNNFTIVWDRGYLTNTEALNELWLVLDYRRSVDQSVHEAEEARQDEWQDAPAEELATV